MRKYRVTFNKSGFFAGAGIWESLEELNEIYAYSEAEAIEAAKEWYDDPECNNFAWLAEEVD